MNQGKYIFAQLTDFLPRHVFDRFRRVKYYDEELDREFVFITNNMELSAEEVALLYKNRWQVELKNGVCKIISVGKQESNKYEHL